jgi:myo-inositol-1(or 4)-monophosphatase
MPPDPIGLLELAVRLVRSGGRLVVDGREQAAAGEVATKSSPTDVVTVMDRACEQLISDGLRQARPGDAILGEEGGERAGRSGVRWLLDPIDGTVNYLYGIPAYAVSLAAEVTGVVVAGAVLNPLSGELWTAVRGRGAWLGDEPLAGRRLHGPTIADRLDGALVATGFGYAARRRATQVEVLRTLLPRVRDIRRIGAASLDLCSLATGRVDAYFERGLQPWDLAAGGLVAAEAGLLVTGLRGAPPGVDMVVAGPPALHRELHDLLVDLRADEGA